MRIREQLDSIASAGLERKLTDLEETGGKISIQGRDVLNFSSNDYLNLAKHPEVIKASQEAIARYGCGSTASRLMTGNLKIHGELEAALAELLGKEAALVFGSGFLTNQGVITALTDKNYLIFADKLNHASLIDGVRLSGASCFRYRHKDMAHLEKLLKKADPQTEKIIISDSIFSMDGDIAPLADLVELAKKYKTNLFIDEAHAIGIFGNGGGILKEMGLSHEADLISGTLSKALGSYGGFVACSAEMRKLLINKARSFIYSTGLPPACLGAALEAISKINSLPLGVDLQELSKEFHQMLRDSGLSLPEYESQIIPIHVGDNRKAVAFSEDLLEHGLLCTAVRPPTVPKGTARLRLTVSLAHSSSDLKNAAAILHESAERMGVI